QAFANLIAEREVLRLACVCTQIDQELHQPVDERFARIVSLRLLNRLRENAKDLAQFAQKTDAAREEIQNGHVGRAAFELLGVGKAIEGRQQFVQDANGASGVEVVIHVLEESLAQFDKFSGQWDS